MKFFDRPLVAPALVVSIALFLGLWIVASGIAGRNSENVITSTGSASIQVKADDAKWTVSVYKEAYEGQTAAAYAEVSHDAEAVKNYFKSTKLASSTITSNVAAADQQYKDGPTTYRVHQEITIESSDVDGIQALAQNINGLTSQGINLSPQQPEYYVTDLPDLRVKLMGKAVADAKTRAQQLAESGGSSIGALLSASSGSVQVLPPNSTGGDEYGAYDTSTIQKQVSVTAHVTFAVK